MKQRKKIQLLVLSVLIVSFSTQEIFSCSTFMLNKKDTLIVGHNLDKGKHAHGVVVVNKRGVVKQARSWTKLAYNKSVPNPPVQWTSKYGSITFNRFCITTIEKATAKDQAKGFKTDPGNIHLQPSFAVLLKQPSLSVCRINPFAGDVKIFGLDFNADEFTTHPATGHPGGA